jgi:hypothetical protein
MKNFLRSILAPDSLRTDDYLFTLDHDGGLVVSLDALEKSGALSSQLEGVRLLKELQKKARTRSSQEIIPE